MSDVWRNQRRKLENKIKAIDQNNPKRHQRDYKDDTSIKRFADEHYVYCIRTFFVYKKKKVTVFTRKNILRKFLSLFLLFHVDSTLPGCACAKEHTADAVGSSGEELRELRELQVMREVETFKLRFAKLMFKTFERYEKHSLNVHEKIIKNTGNIIEHT